MNESHLQIPAEEITAQLTRVLCSTYFAHSTRLSRFLRFTVERSAAGRVHDLKEYTIGVEVYDRKPPYHPNEDSIVRTEARRLRYKLKQYYQGEGKDDPIQFYFRLGSYVPVFRRAELVAEENHDAQGRDVQQTDSTGVIFVVFPFEDISGTAFTASFAHGLTDAVIHWIMQAEGCRAIAYSTLQTLGLVTLGNADIARELGAQVALQGTVREEGGRIRVTCTFVSLPGLQRWSERFEFMSTPNSLFELEEQIARALVARVAPQSLNIRHRQRNAKPEEVAYYPDLLGAEALLDRCDKLSIQQALNKFIRIEREQPWCARASCGISQSYYWLAMLGEALPPGCAADAMRAADRALGIDSDMGEAHVAQGCALMLCRDWSSAEASFTTGARLASGAPAQRHYADFLIGCGRFHEAFQILERVQNIDPFSCRQKVSYSRFLYMGRRFHDGLAYWSALAKYGEKPLEVLLFEALTYIHVGEPQRATTVAATVIRQAGGSLPILANACNILALSGDRHGALSLCDSHRLLLAATPLAAVRKALLAVALEDFVHAEQLFSDAFRLGQADVCWLGVDPRCDRVAAAPYFNAMLQNAPTASPPRVSQ